MTDGDVTFRLPWEEDVRPILGYGLVVNPTVADYSTGEIVFAELTPATWKGRWRRPWQWDRWWWEVQTVNAPKTVDNPHGIGVHYWQHDGSALTLRGAVRKAMDAVEAVADELEKDRHGQRVEAAEDQREPSAPPDGQRAPQGPAGTLLGERSGSAGPPPGGAGTTGTGEQEAPRGRGTDPVGGGEGGQA